MKNIRLLYIIWSIISIGFILFGVGGLIIFSKFEKYIIHPILYPLLILLGIGWFITLSATVIDLIIKIRTRRKDRCK